MYFVLVVNDDRDTNIFHTPFAVEEVQKPPVQAFDESLSERLTEAVQVSEEVQPATTEVQPARNG